MLVSNKIMADFSNPYSLLCTCHNFICREDSGSSYFGTNKGCPCFLTDEHSAIRRVGKVHFASNCGISGGSFYGWLE